MASSRSIRSGPRPRCRARWYARTQTGRNVLEIGQGRPYLPPAIMCPGTLGSILVT
jgi:hypothetical protein